MQLGRCADGRVLTYDAGLYEFRLAGKPAEFDEVRALDARAQVRWRAAEMRDWFVRIDAADLAACHERAVEERYGVEYDKLSAEERVLADAARDDSVLAGKIVDADPALVHAVANQLIEEGLLAQVPGAAASAGGAGTDGAAGGAAEANPLAAMDLPRGMEPLSQLERAKAEQGERRKMTRSEARLMRKILKNDDKAKAKRERRAEAAAASRPIDETGTSEETE